ncbi:hypothetical protein HY625_00530 [Candidatus Uhrbacteria bacterium]|nr:hypothetical protein [Candidatus Uhrbacteria bacterium]
MASGFVRIRHCPEHGCRGTLFARRRALTMLCVCDCMSCQKTFIVSLALGTIERFPDAPEWHRRIAIASSWYMRLFAAHEEVRRHMLEKAMKNIGDKRTRVFGDAATGFLEESEIFVLLDAVENTKVPDKEKGGAKLDAPLKKGKIIPIRRTA